MSNLVPDSNSTTSLGLVWYDPFGKSTEGALFVTIRSLRSNGQCVCYAQRKPGPLHVTASMGIHPPKGNDFFHRVQTFMDFASPYGLETEHRSDCLARFVCQSFDGESSTTELMMEIKESSPEPVQQRARELLSYLSSELKLAVPELTDLGANTM